MLKLMNFYTALTWIYSINFPNEWKFVAQHWIKWQFQSHWQNVCDISMRNSHSYLPIYAVWYMRSLSSSFTSNSIAQFLSCYEHFVYIIRKFSLLWTLARSFRSNLDSHVPKQMTLCSQNSQIEYGWENTNNVTYKQPHLNRSVVGVVLLAVDFIIVFTPINVYTLERCVYFPFLQCFEQQKNFEFFPFTVSAFGLLLLD